MIFSVLIGMNIVQARYYPTQGRSWTGSQSYPQGYQDGYGYPKRFLPKAYSLTYPGYARGGQRDQRGYQPRDNFAQNPFVQRANSRPFYPSYQGKTAFQSGQQGSLGRQPVNPQSTWRRQMSVVPIQLRGFEKRDHDPQLIDAFRQFIATLSIRGGDILKIVRSKGAGKGQNKYSYCFVQQAFGLLGSQESNSSTCLGARMNLPYSFILPHMLDDEDWISKIVMTFDGQQWSIAMFGRGHTFARGMARLGKGIVMVGPSALL